MSPEEADDRRYGAGDDPPEQGPATSPPGAVPTWRLERRADGGIDFHGGDGSRHEDADLRRGFPLSAPREGVAVIAADGGELAWIESLDAVPPVVRAVIEDVLAAREFVPVIERIDAIPTTLPASRTAASRSPIPAGSAIGCRIPLRSIPTAAGSSTGSSDPSAVPAGGHPSGGVIGGGGEVCGKGARRPPSPRP
jgi:hypothetical protein